MATDYGHWDATLRDCVGLARQPALDEAHAEDLLWRNAVRFYGSRLVDRIQRGGARIEIGDAVQAAPGN